MDNIFERVKEVIVAELACKEEDVTPDARFVEDLGADSLDVVQLVMVLEDKFQIDIPDEDVERLRTVDDVVNYIQQKVGVEA
ncbi:MAG TPA: acyl carrier protein [Fimbriimonadales bacterium]|nr:acyl carrier protein [Fimbriimonadales bacterium]